MRVIHRDATLQRVETDANFNGGLAKEIVSAFRRRMQQIRAALDERAFYALKSLHFEKLQGDRSHQRSMRINDQWRLIVELQGGDEVDGKKTVVVIGIEDYHYTGGDGDDDDDDDPNDSSRNFSHDGLPKGRNGSSRVESS